VFLQNEVLVMYTKETHIQTVINTMILAAMLLLVSSCGGGGGAGAGGNGGGDGSSSASLTGVALYLTDAVSDYQQVMVKVTNVKLVNSGTKNTCTVLDRTVTVDLAHLSTIMQFISSTQCAAVPYNRIDIEFLRAAQLTDAAGTPSACAFTSYKDQGNQPNALVCDPASDRCTLPIRGAVHSSSFDVQSDKHNKLTLDFSLKDFTIADFGLATCSVTMKVSPMNASDMKKKGSQEAVTGLVVALDQTTRTFLLSTGTTTFSVSYAGITAQPGIDLLLTQAASEGFPVMVTTNGIDFGTMVVDASSAYAYLAGTVSVFNKKDGTFTLTYGASAKTLAMSYASPSMVEGKIANGSWIKAKVYGYESVSQQYLASHIEVFPSGKHPEDDEEDD
jgi:hypothetical protein